MQKLFFSYLLVINTITFFLFALDKHKAKKHLWRIPEKTLLLFSATGGSLGAILGMCIFRHKTRHLKFTLGVPFILIIQLFLFFTIKAIGAYFTWFNTY